MGDLLRRVLYPLFVPAIVVTVWAHAWSAKLDAERRMIPPGPLTGDPVVQAPPTRMKLEHWAPQYGFAREDSFASTDDAEADGE
jgi:hypothetical protein